jgi:hypothetical protein
VRHHHHKTPTARSRTSRTYIVTITQGRR